MTGRAPARCEQAGAGTARFFAAMLLAVALTAAAVIFGHTLSLADSPPPRDVLTATQHWERWNVDEPNVWRAGGRWWMLYTGGWQPSALGVASSQSVFGPWHRYAGNPVIGDGRAGVADAGQSNVYVERGVAYAYFPTRHGDLVVATANAAHPLRWTVHRKVLRRTATADFLANSSMVKQGSRYVMLVESHTDNGTCCWWRTGLAVGRSPLGPFTWRQFPLASLRVGDRSSMYGGPDLLRTAHGWRVYYHASHDGGLPTDIYTATSTDLIHWTHKRLLIRRSTWHDQAADPCVVMTQHGPVAFFSAMDNPQEFGSIQAVRLSK